MMKILLTVVAILAFGCDGKNIFEDQIDKSKYQSSSNPEMQKIIDMLLNGDYESAINALRDYIAAHPDDFEAISMLANSYLKKAGLDALDFSGAVAKITSTGGGINIKSLMKTVPEATTENLTAIRESVSAFSLIPASERTSVQNFQTSMAQMSYATELMKSQTADASGTFNRDVAAQSLSVAEADEIIASFQASVTSLEASGGESNAGSAGSLSRTLDAIEQSSGGNSAERLINYLAAQPSN